MIETEICEKIAANPVLAAAFGDRIMAMDFRAADWANAVNYLGDSITVIDPYGFIYPSVVVDRRGLGRSLVLRGAGKFMDEIDVWVYGPRGVTGYSNAVDHKNIIEEFHQDSLPGRQIMMLSGSIGPLDDGKNLMTNVSFQLTRVMEDTNG